MILKVFFFWQAIKEEDKEYSELKKQLRTEIRDMRRNVSYSKIFAI